MVDRIIFCKPSEFIDKPLAHEAARKWTRRMIHRPDFLNNVIANIVALAFIRHNFTVYKSS